MRAILIDVHCRCIQMIQVGLTMPDVYQAMRCNHVSAVYPLPFAFSTDLFYVDDHALDKPLSQETGGFFLGEPQYPIFGNSLIVGCDRKGNRTEPSMTLTALARKIRFLEPEEVVLYHSLLEHTAPKIFYW